MRVEIQIILASQEEKADSSRPLESSLMLWVNKCFLFLDNDECAAIPSICDSENGVCMNSAGSYNCSCNPGYELGNDNFTCDGKDNILN